MTAANICAPAPVSTKRADSKVATLATDGGRAKGRQIMNVGDKVEAKGWARTVKGTVILIDGESVMVMSLNNKRASIGTYKRDKVKVLDSAGSSRLADVVAQNVAMKAVIREFIDKIEPSL